MTELRKARQGRLKLEMLLWCYGQDQSLSYAKSTVLPLALGKVSMKRSILSPLPKFLSPSIKHNAVYFRVSATHLEYYTSNQGNNCRPNSRYHLNLLPRHKCNDAHYATVLKLSLSNSPIF